MESRNPEQELPDERLASEKLEDAGEAPNPEPTESLKKIPPKGESMDEVEGGASDVEELLHNLDGFSVKSLDDLYRIKEMLIQFENKKIYES